MRKDISKIKKEKPIISVCITTFNRKRLFIKAFDSIVNQTFTNFEIIIINDSSNDGTDEYVKEHILPNFKNIKYFYNENNIGLAKSRNIAIHNSSGKYFTFLDDDDEWKIFFLEDNMAALLKHKDSQMAFSSIIAEPKIKYLKSSFKNLIELGYTPPVSSQVYQTQLLINSGGYKKNIKSGVDHDLWITLASKNFSIIWLNKTLVKVNPLQSDDRMTFNLEKRVNGINDSLKLWENALYDIFNKDFYFLFKKNYKYNTYKKFILLFLKQKKYLNVILLFKNISLSFLAKDIIRYVRAHFLNNYKIYPPVFFTTRKLFRENFSKIITFEVHEK